MIVGVAYVENSTPRSVSKRSIDLISPMVPTWSRSSNGSPRLRNRRAQCSTSGRCSVDQLRRGTRSRSGVGGAVRRVSSANSSALRARVVGPGVARRAEIPGRHVYSASSSSAAPIVDGEPDTVGVTGRPTSLVSAVEHRARRSRPGSAGAGSRTRR